MILMIVMMITVTECLWNPMIYSWVQSISQPNFREDSFLFPVFFPCGPYSKQSRGVIFNILSLKCVLFWLTKTSVSVETCRLSFSVIFWFICALHSEAIYIFRREYRIFIPIFVLFLLRYFLCWHGLSLARSRSLSLSPYIYMRVHMCVCVCEWEREREGKRGVRE